MKLHYSEADLLETYYMQPGQSMPVMMHLASCSECAARYEHLDRKLRETGSCSTERNETFWTRQRLSIMRRIDDRKRFQRVLRHSMRTAAAAAAAFLLGGTVAYEALVPRTETPAVVVRHHVAPVSAERQDAQSVIHDPWQSEELEEFHQVVDWESWVDSSSGGHS